MGQYMSRTAVSMNAHAKSGNTTQDVIKPATTIKQSFLKKLRKAKTQNQQNSFILTEATSTEVDLTTTQITTINLHIEDTGEVSATTSRNHCETHCCTCSLNSARQLIIKIQLSKMEQPQLKQEQCSSVQTLTLDNISQQKIAGNLTADNKLATDLLAEKSSVKLVSPYVPKLLTQDCSKAQTSTNTTQHSNEQNKCETNAQDAAQLSAVVTLPKSAELTNAACSSLNTSISVTPQYKRPIVHSQVELVHCLVPDLDRITNASYYWGKMDRYEAERLLEGKEEGTFLLRDSAQEEFLFSVTFRKYERSLHARIEQSGHKFSFDCHDPCVYTASTITGLLDHYKDPSCVMFFEPMLTIPLHRRQPFSLQQLCRAKIVPNTTYDGINQMELPVRLKAYLKEFHYKQKLRILTLENGMYGSSWCFPDDT